RVLFLLRNFFWQNMHQPESCDADNRRDHQHDPRDAIGDRIKRLAMEKRGVCLGWRRDQRKGDQWNEAPAITVARLSDGGDLYISCFTLHCLFPLYRLPNSFCRDPEARNSSLYVRSNDAEFGCKCAGLPIGL